jgi:hypothetical protein
MVLVLNAKFFATRSTVTGGTWFVAGGEGLPETVATVRSGDDGMVTGVPVSEGVTVAVVAGVTGPGVVLHPAAPRRHAVRKKIRIKYTRSFISGNTGRCI